MGVNQTVGFPTQQAFVGDLIPRRQLQEAVGMYSLDVYKRQREGTA